MSGKTHQLSIAIGGALKNSFKTAISGSTHQLQALGSTIKQLKTQGKTFSQFDQAKRHTLQAKKAWHAAQGTVRQLAMTLKATDKPTKTLQKDFDRARRSAEKAKSAYVKQRDSLGQLSRKLREGGVDLGRLQLQQQQTARSTALLSHQYTLLDRTLKNRQGILNRRSALRGQLFDAVALTAALGAPVKAAIDFESAMADVRKVVDFDTPDGLVKLGDTLKVMSRRIPITAAGLAQIAASGGQLGIVAKDLPDFTNTVSQMVIAFDMSAEEAGNAMAKLANVYQIPINRMHVLGDAINYLSNNTAAKARDMIPALNMIGGIARQFGLTAVQASALVSALISLGKAPTKAGTAINAILSKLQTAAKQGPRFQAAFQSLGLDPKAFEKGIASDAQGTLLKFFKAVEKVDKQKRSGLLLDLFGMEYQSSAALLVGSLKTYEKAINAVSHAENYQLSMQKEFDNRAATTANNLQLLKNATAEISMNLGAVLLPALNTVTNVLRKFSIRLAAGAQRFPLLTKVLVGTAAGLMSVRIASIALGYAWTFIRGGAVAITLIFRGVAVAVTLMKTRLMALNAVSLMTASRFRLLAAGGAIKTVGKLLWGLGARALPGVIAGLRALSVACLSNPIGLIIGGILLAAGLIITHWKKVKTFLLKLWEPVKPVWLAFAGWVQKLWQTISQPFTAIKTVWQTLLGKPHTVVSTNSHLHSRGDSALQFAGMTSGLSGSRKNPLLSPLKSTTINHTRQHNQVTIHIHPHPDQDTKSLADEIMQRFQVQSQGALYDAIGVPS
nr:hypothetical protein 7 [Coxiellaceae bacterium]